MDRKIQKIYIHCSAGRFGTVAKIREWHRKRGFRDIGYHYIVLNPFSTFGQWFKHQFKKDYLFTSITDGKVVVGRPLELAGAHVRSDNDESIGICYVGITPSTPQYFSLLTLCLDLMEEHDISVDNVLGHHEWYLNNDLPLKKTCPNFDMVSFRSLLKI